MTHIVDTDATTGTDASIDTNAIIGTNAGFGHGGKPNIGTYLPQGTARLSPPHATGAAGCTFHESFFINRLPSANVDKHSCPFHAVDGCRIDKFLCLVSVG